MSIGTCVMRVVCCAMIGSCFGGWCDPAFGALPDYQLVGTYDLPSGTASFDAMPDGRVIALRGDEILLQSAVNGSTFTMIGSLTTGQIGPFGGSFIRANPSGTTIAIGDNQAGFGPQNVILLDMSGLDPFVPSAGQTVSAPNFDAHWADNDTLYVSGSVGFADPAQITEVRASTLSVRTVVGNLQGAPGGVTTDGTYLYAGNGFASGGGSSQTGEVRAFSLSAITGSTLDYESDGLTVADVLSGNSLGFDHIGNMLIGGSDAFGSGDGGYAGVVDGAAIDAALAGGGIAPPSAVLQLTPASADEFYLIQFNAFTEEVLVTYFGTNTVYRYALIPAPGTGVALAAGLLGFRRRRRAG